MSKVELMMNIVCRVYNGEGQEEVGLLQPKPNLRVGLSPVQGQVSVSGRGSAVCNRRRQVVMVAGLFVTYKFVTYTFSNVQFMICYWKSAVHPQRPSEMVYIQKSIYFGLGQVRRVSYTNQSRLEAAAATKLEAAAATKLEAAAAQGL